jgi:hypothetical protein
VQERAGLETELVEHGVEGASGPAVAPEHAVDVEGRGAEALGDGQHLGRIDEQEHRLRVDEAADQPGAGDAVDLGPGAGDPDGAALGIARRQLGGLDERLAGGAPGLEAALQRLGVDAGVPEPGGRALAQLQALLADDDGGLAAVFVLPGVRACEVAPAGAGLEARVGGPVLVGTYIDEPRSAGQANETGELCYGDFGG